MRPRGSEIRQIVNRQHLRRGAEQRRNVQKRVHQVELAERGVKRQRELFPQNPVGSPRGRKRRSNEFRPGCGSIRVFADAAVGEDHVLVATR